MLPELSYTIGSKASYWGLVSPSRFKSLQTFLSEAPNVNMFVTRRTEFLAVSVREEAQLIEAQNPYAPHS